MGYGRMESRGGERPDIMLNAVYCSIALLSWAVLIISFIRDRSRYRNCYLLALTLALTFLAITFFAGDYQKAVLSFTLITMILVLLVVPLFLICNGILMLKREGRSAANLLSLGLGLIIGLGEIATAAAVLLPQFAGVQWEIDHPLVKVSRFSMFVGVSVMYFSASFVVFMLYCVFLQIIPKKRDFDYVIIHGAGLLEGEKVSRLLADRLDKAIEVYHKDPTPPVLIPSGGRGDDEKISEAAAMEKYLLEKGIPAGKIIIEDRSATTFENLENSKAIIDAQEGSRYIALVTSNYHVYRALRYCRKIGLRCVGIGSRVALYYWPSALIREYIAIHAEKKHLFYLIAGWILCMIPLFLSYYS